MNGIPTREEVEQERRERIEQGFPPVGADRCYDDPKSLVRVCRLGTNCDDRKCSGKTEFVIEWPQLRPYRGWGDSPYRRHRKFVCRACAEKFAKRKGIELP